VGNDAQNYRVSRATEQLLITQTSWDPFLFAISTYLSKFQFSTDLPTLFACQTDPQYYIIIDGTCSCTFPYIPFV